MIDVVVVGGGPVGLATALYARRAGLSVTVIEKRSAPVDKACGEGLTPAAVAALAQLGISPPGKPFRGIRYIDGTHVAEAGFYRGAHGLGVRRTVLHQALSSAAAAAGVPVLHEAAGTIRQGADRVTVGGTTARYLVAADGLHSPIARSLGLDRDPSVPRRWGLRRHFATPPWTDMVEVHWSADAEAYVTPVDDQLVGIALLTSHRGNYDEQLADFPALQSRIAGTASGPALGAGPLRHATRRRVAGRVLLVGDAAGYVDALTGEGIAVGLAAAKELVRCLADDDPQRYERSWARATRGYRLLTRGLLALSRSRARGFIVPAAGRFPRGYRAAVNQLVR